ncbi:MAG TPA: SusC/RagA family TonB-linked outer membrane protein [Chitinophagaceae bacterium]|nr:SusC/RagA family TonB-linked outer membrane protein [Chitinophagaceae bacterium]
MRKHGSLLAVSLLFCIMAFCQSRTITGQVKDETGPVPFATITETNTTNVKTADVNGNFSITITGNSLTISAVNHQTQTVAVSGNTVNVTLVRSEGQLQEVVVTALGQTRSKTKVGYATTTLNNEAINRTSPVSPLDALAGKIPGANISKTGGPNSSSKVILRGYGIVAGGGNQPLYVIDGVPLTDARFGATANYDFGQTIADINPNDIESITVLKGTAAASLYGSQARNGAIMITTRKGKSGKIKVDYAGSVNFSTVGKLPEFQKIFGQGWSGVFILSENGSWGPKFDNKERLWGSIVDNSQLLKPFSFIKDNLRDFYETGVEYNNSISLSGGGENTNFYFSYSNVNSDGVVPTSTDFLNRNTLALRTNSKFNKFSINTSFNFSKRKVNAPYTGQSGSDGGSTFEEILQIPTDIPITDLRDYKNKFFNVDNYFTPFAENPYYPLYENRSTQNAERFFGNLDLNYSFTSSLSAQLRVGGDFDNARTFAYKAVNAPKPGSWNGPNPTNPEGATRQNDVGSVSEVTNYIGVINGDFILKYNKNLSTNFSLEALGGYNYYQQDQKGVTATITDLLVPGFYNLSNSTAPPTATDAILKRKSMGVYGQAIVGFRDQVFLTLNGRNDWSSTLPIDHNSVFYPGANIAWVASQTFGLNKTSLSLLKFRAAYGKTGADPAPYLTDQTLVIGSINLPFGSLTLPYNGVSGFGISNTIANSSLKPIITKEAEFGVEARFFKNRLGIDAAVYDKRTDGQIFTVPIAPSTGYTGLVQNLGLVSNRGVEVALDAKPVNMKDLVWSLTYTFSKNWNKVEELNGGPDFVPLSSLYDADLRAYPGKNIFGVYAPVPQMTEDGKLIINPQTGVPLVADEKGFYGNADYDYMMGLSNTLSYKELQLSFSFDYRKGGIMYTGTGDLLQFTGNAFVTTYNDRRPFIIPNSVIEAGTDPNGKPIYEENTTPIVESGYDAFWYPTTNKAMSYNLRFVDRSFLKLRDVALSYKLPKALASKIKATNLMVSVYGSNFILWTPRSNIYLDPEATNLGNDLTSQFGEFRTGPTSKQFGVSLKASF